MLGEHVSPVIYPSFMRSGTLAAGTRLHLIPVHKAESLKGFCFTRHNVIKDLSTAPWQKAFPCDHSVKWPVLQNSKGSLGFTQNVLCQSNGTELTGAVLLHTSHLPLISFFHLALIASLYSGWDEDRKLPPSFNQAVVSLLSKPWWYPWCSALVPSPGAWHKAAPAEAEA